MSGSSVGGGFEFVELPVVPGDQSEGVADCFSTLAWKDAWPMTRMCALGREARAATPSSNRSDAEPAGACADDCRGGRWLASDR